jgi:hypothetical protein
MKLRLYDIFDRMIGNKRARRRKYYNIRFKPFTVGSLFYILTIDNKIVFKDKILKIEPTVLYFSIYKNPPRYNQRDGFFLEKLNYKIISGNKIRSITVQ